MASSARAAGGNAGAGGNGGNAVASATTSITPAFNSYNASGIARATGGPARFRQAGHPGSFSGNPANGGLGGTAMASARVKNTRGSANAIVYVTGGRGGDCDAGFLGKGGVTAGAGGVANNSYAVAHGNDATAIVHQIGGAGGTGFNGAAGGAGADSILNDAVSGTTTGGYLFLLQRCKGRCRRRSKGRARKGGNAAAYLGFDDSRNPMHATSFTGYVDTIGGQAELAPAAVLTGARLRGPSK